jgi:membrane-associated phospholipid phosphatase
MEIQNWFERLTHGKLGPIKGFRAYMAIGLGLAILAILLFAKLAEEVVSHELTGFDLWVYNFIAQFKTPLLTNFMKTMSFLGSFLVLIPLALVTILFTYYHKRHYWDSVMVGVSLVGGFILNEILKWAFHRQRPNISRLVEATGYSFPSGHSMTSFAFYGFLAYIFWINLDNKLLRLLVTGFLGLLIFLIGLSRIYLGVHYASDVIGGFVAGSFWVIGCILSLESIRYYKSNVNLTKNQRLYE